MRTPIAGTVTSRTDPQRRVATITINGGTQHHALTSGLHTDSSTNRSGREQPRAEYVNCGTTVKPRAEKESFVAETHRLPEPLVVHWEWQNQAACRGMDSSTFYHPTGEPIDVRGNRIAAAKIICNQCPVITECLDHALRVREPYGIWGGLSEAERADLLGVRTLRW
ncbi:WhiB family transcriptional regulator [Nakamurella sp. GG22]